MVFRLGKEQALLQLLRQINLMYYPTITASEEKILFNTFDSVIERCEINFSHNNNKYYHRVVDGILHTYFDAYHTCQWLIFLYYYANTLFLKYGDEVRTICDKIYGISKITGGGVDIFYEVKLPTIFSCDHPSGSVIGRATYRDYFKFSQGCTVGNNYGEYPILGEHVTMHSDSKIIGNCHIGNNVIISANSYIKDQNTPNNVIVFGRSPNLFFKELKLDIQV